MCHPQDPRNLKIADLEFPLAAARVKGACAALGLVHLGELIRMTEEELVPVRNMGHKCVRSINFMLVTYGLSLGSVCNDWSPPVAEQT